MNLPRPTDGPTFPPQSRLHASADQIQELLCDVLLGIDDLRSVVGSPDAMQFDWMKEPVEEMFDNVNSLMKRVAD
jgi:hypothetical protein